MQIGLSFCAGVFAAYGVIGFGLSEALYRIEALPALANEFNTILGFIEQLNEVDVDGIEPMTSVTPMRLKRREDVVTDGNMQDKILSNAPDAREGFFAVPKVVE